MNRRHDFAMLGLRAMCALLLLVVALSGCQLHSPGDESAAAPARSVSPPAALASIDSPAIRHAVAVQNRNTDSLLKIPGVVGTATGVDRNGAPVILVLASDAAAALVPAALEDLPVAIKSADGIFAMNDADALPLLASTTARPDSVTAALAPTDRFPRPVPIGVATGNRYYCASGTISARVKDSAGRVYALSNNHVFALENRAPLNSWILQPGLVETSCVVDQQNAMALLKAYQPIRFGLISTNTIDAAVAITTTAYLGTGTPSDGYGVPKSQIAAAAVGQAVQKYGRTTALTHGAVTGINASIFVGYTSGTALFVNQIIIESPTAFILPGDSGSLLVSDPGRNPVGLCFAGNANGTMGIANPIGAVLTRFGVTIDGE